MKVVLDRHFDDLDRFSEAVYDWDLDFRLLDVGGFAGSVRQAVSDDVLVSYARFESRLDQAGATPQGFRTFVIPGQQCYGFWWRGRQVGNSDLLAFPFGGELRSASNRDFEVFVVSVRESLMEQLAEDMRVSASLVFGDRPEAVGIDSHTMGELRIRAERAISAATASGDSTARCLAERLVVLQGARRAKPSPSARKRDLAVDRIVDYVRSTLTPVQEMAVLCRIAGASERTLQYAFKERYGISPAVFVKRWKLNSARRVLMGSAGNTSVGDVATRLEFWHQSQFAADYQTLFRELPSQTVRCRAGDQFDVRQLR